MTENEPTGSKIQIETKQLSKFYGDFAAVRDVTFNVKQGEIVAFLGPNGAGKSTTMKILVGYLNPTYGSARVAGFDVAENRLEVAGRVGYLPENGPLYPDMTPLELLKFFGEARGLSRDEIKRRMSEVISLCMIESVRNKPVRKLSKGFRQRVGLAQALLHDPEVLILDEPTAGLDPNQIREVRKALTELSRSKTILLSTHILQEVEAIAHRVVVISEGRIVYDGDPAGMAARGRDLDDAFTRLTQTAGA